MFEVRRVNGNTFDVFLGNQWGTWLRVRKGRSSLYRVAGERVSHAILHALNDIIACNMPINYGQTPEQTLLNCQAIYQSR